MNDAEAPPSGHQPGRVAVRGGTVQVVSAGLLTATVGFASSFAIVLQGFAAVGASPAQAASGLLALLLATGGVAVILGSWTRMPISIAWSTPGAALLIATGRPEGGYPVAVGAFLVASGLVLLSGLWRPFGRAVAAIPISLAGAMLAGLLLELCLAPMRAVGAVPHLALPIVAVWAVGWRFWRPYAVPVAVVATAAIIALATPIGGTLALRPVVVLIAPRFTLDALIGIALPLFVVTMASQNVPGLAVLTSNGFKPPIRMIFTATGLASAIIAPFGAHLVNLAAITAALSAGPDAHPDPGRRWIASVISGIGYIALGLGATFATSFVAASPPLLIEGVAGLALLGSLGSSLQAALAREEERVPAMVTFVTAASGVSFFGIGAAFWGLVAGLAMIGLAGLRR